MSIAHVAAVGDLPPAGERFGASGTDRLVLLALAESANRDTDECWPSTATIARFAGIRQAKYVRRSLAALADAGLVEVDPNGCPDRRIRADRRPNLYRLVGPLALARGGATRPVVEGHGGARRAATGGRDAPPNDGSHLSIPKPEDEPSLTPPSPPSSDAHVDAPTGPPSAALFDTGEAIAVDEVRTVFDAWRTAVGLNGNTRLTEDRRRVIRSAITRHGLDDVLAAVQGIALSPFHMGDNDRGTRYNDVTNALRQARHVEQFAGYHRDPSTAPRPSGARRSERDRQAETIADRVAAATRALGDGGSLLGAPQPTRQLEP